ncbi:hypothetical protein IC617_07565 [Neiella sp. HB171785]|uniref:CRISPR type III-associated protein domain-containing protein n=1 Tax=Neiella litorisoli TaxID=2771431 RepID=A0A8J6QUN7_9GAMM|nr:hypothetical protein [Neiella litorisoli]
MAVNSGQTAKGFDADLVRDANGLPIIPATSLIGALRHCYERNSSNSDWFGNKDESSKVSATFGCVHNQLNQPIQGLISPAEIEQDDLLSRLIQKAPVKRDRVALNERGVAKDKAQFDQVALPKGTRFTFDLVLQEAHKVGEAWHALLDVLAHPLLRLGATTRNGFGCFDVKAIETVNWNLKAEDAATSYAHLNRRINGSLHDESYDYVPNTKVKPIVKASLKAESGWISGTGHYDLSGKNRSSINRFSGSEVCIKWLGSGDSQRAEINAPKATLTASTIKGILAHRMAFHYRCIKNEFVDENAEWLDQARPDALDRLLGSVSGPDSGQAGLLFFEDAELNYEQTQVRQHNSIDRFTGGVRDGALFNEQVIYQPDIEFSIYAVDNVFADDEDTKNALKLTLADLAEGRLALGAYASKGHSYVHGNIVCMGELQGGDS